MELSRREVLTWLLWDRRGRIRQHRQPARGESRSGRCPGISDAGRRIRREFSTCPSVSLPDRSRAGDPLPGGGTTPGRHDGTASFVGRGAGCSSSRTTRSGPATRTRRVAAPELTYDPKAMGGTTTLSLDHHLNRVDDTSAWPARGQLRRRPHPVGHVAHLRGDRDHGRRHRRQGPRLRVRGRPGAPGATTSSPTPLRALGRFAHEAVVVDPHRGDRLPDRGRKQPQRSRLPLLTERSDATATARCATAAASTAMRCSLRGTHVPDLSVFSTPGTTSTSRGSPSPTRRRPRCRSASSSPTPTSPAAASSKAPGGATPPATATARATAAATARTRWPTSCAPSPGSATAPRRARRPGVGFRPGQPDAHTRAVPPGQPAPELRHPRRARQHLRLALRRVLPRRGRRRCPTPPRGRRAAPFAPSPATTSAAPSSPA